MAVALGRAEIGKRDGDDGTDGPVPRLQQTDGRCGDDDGPEHHERSGDADQRGDPDVARRRLRSRLSGLLPRDDAEADRTDECNRNERHDLEPGNVTMMRDLARDHDHRGDDDEHAQRRAHRAGNGGGDSQHLGAKT